MKSSAGSIRSGKIYECDIKSMLKVNIFLLSLCPAVLAGCQGVAQPVAELLPGTPEQEQLVELGRELFFDVNLSNNRTQSCATCHDPLRAFTDGRESGVDAAVSLGDDGVSLGDRNAPTLAYISFTPDFSRDQNGEYSGGLFHDGRAATLVEQAGLPIINPVEMGMPDIAAVAGRIRENPRYVERIQQLFGSGIQEDAELLFIAITRSIAAFEQTELFAPFDSKYDRHLRGEYRMSKKEKYGHDLFFSGLTNCSSCHMLQTSTGHPRETFSDYRYYNIGVPVNVRVREKNGMAGEYRDSGLLDNPLVADSSHAGKFKVPTLRNIAVTSPYMHNGVFRELHTAVQFYGKYLVHNTFSQINPETGEPWGQTEFPQTVDVDLLRQGQPLDRDRVEALVAFLKLLTDRRYEPLLE